MPITKVNQVTVKYFRAQDDVLSGRILCSPVSCMNKGQEVSILCEARLDGGPTSSGDNYISCIQCPVVSMHSGIAEMRLLPVGQHGNEGLYGHHYLSRDECR